MDAQAPAHMPRLLPPALLIGAAIGGTMCYKTSCLEGMMTNLGLPAGNIFSSSPPPPSFNIDDVVAELVAPTATTVLVETTTTLHYEHHHTTRASSVYRQPPCSRHRIGELLGAFLWMWLCVLLAAGVLSRTFTRRGLQRAHPSSRPPPPPPPSAPLVDNESTPDSPRLIPLPLSPPPSPTLSTSSAAATANAEAEAEAIADADADARPDEEVQEDESPPSALAKKPPIESLAHAPYPVPEPGRKKRRTQRSVNWNVRRQQEFTRMADAWLRAMDLEA